jgi:hypothetical protein
LAKHLASRRVFRCDRSAVSEVVGSVLLLVITVACFGVLFLLVNGQPRPPPGASADFNAELQFTSNTTAVVVLQHLGGDELTDSNAAIIVSVNSLTFSNNVSSGVAGASAFSVGMTWRYAVPVAVNSTSRVFVSVISYTSNSVLYSAELQRGFTAAPGGYAPVITVAWAVSAASTPEVYNNEAQTFRIHAVALDADGDLNPAGGVWAVLTVTTMGSTFAASSLSSGHFNLTQTDQSHFQSPDLVMAAAIPPGDYTLTVMAQDMAGHNATASFPLRVLGSAEGAGPTLQVSGTSVSPVSVNVNSTNVPLLRLNLSSAGGMTSVSQVVIAKTGLLLDSHISLSAWTDVDGNGQFNATSDVESSPPTSFINGVASIFAIPITTVSDGGTRTVFIVADLLGASDGTNVTFSITNEISVRGTGIPSGAAATTNGTFPITSNELVIGSKLDLIYTSGIPDRILINSNNVRILDFRIRAAGESFFVKRVNVTLLGDIPRSNAVAYVKINGQYATSTASFNGARIAGLNMNFSVSDTAGLVSLEVFINITTSQVGRTLGLQLTSVTDSFAVGQLTGKGRNGQAPSPFPISSGIRALSSTGNISIDQWTDPTLETAVRAGMNNIYLFTIKLRAHGENIDFNKLEVARSGNVADGQIAALTLRVRGGTWLSGTFFSGKVTWDAGVTGKLFAININVTNTGEAVADLYFNLSGSTQGSDVTFKVNDNNKVRGWAKVSLTTQYAGAEDEPYALTSGERRVQGDILVWGTNLAPSSVLAPKTLVPIFKLTFRAVGENATLDELFLRSLQGVPPAGSVTVHLYRDVNNDTTTAVNGDDVEVAASEAGPYGSDAIKPFAPAATLTNGTDANFYFAMDITTGAAGIQLENRFNATNTTARGIYSGKELTLNDILGQSNPAILIYQTPPVAVYDRGALSVTGLDVTPETHTHRFIYQRMLRLQVTATEVEAVQITSVKFHLLGNTTPSAAQPNFWWDVNKNGAVSLAEGDVDLGEIWFTSGDVTFAGSPLVTVAAGATEHLLVFMYVTDGAAYESTVGVEASASNFITAVGSTSGLGITPGGTYPAACNVVPVIT